MRLRDRIAKLAQDSRVVRHLKTADLMLNIDLPSDLQEIATDLGLFFVTGDRTPQGLVLTLKPRSSPRPRWTPLDLRRLSSYHGLRWMELKDGMVILSVGEEGL